MYYLPLLEPHTAVEDDDEDFLDDHPEKKRLDFVAPSQKAIKQIIREVCGAALSCFMFFSSSLNKCPFGKNFVYNRNKHHYPVIHRLFLKNSSHVLSERECCLGNSWFARKLHCLKWILCFRVFVTLCIIGRVTTATITNTAGQSGCHVQQGAVLHHLVPIVSSIYSPFVPISFSFSGYAKLTLQCLPDSYGFLPCLPNFFQFLLVSNSNHTKLTIHFFPVYKKYPTHGLGFGRHRCT